MTEGDAVDLVVVPAQNDGFQRVFLGENAWHAIRIRGDLLQRLKYIAAYQSAPVSAITHYAVIDRIEPYDAKGSRNYHTYRLVFRGSAKQINPIPYADATPGMIQGPRYTSLARLLSAKTLKDVF